MKIGIRVSYDGTNLSGFQKQKNSRTVQGDIENALSEILNKETSTIGASRTDAGVHAKDNFLMFETEKNFDDKKWKYILNSKLSEDIVIKESYRVKEDFHPLKAESEKTYVYTIINNEFVQPIKRNYVWRFDRKLNFDIMQKTASIFIGEHDFYEFKSGNKIYKSTKRTIHKSDLEIVGDKIKYTITGNGFMYNMVRIIVGSIVEVGNNKRSIDDIRNALIRKEIVKKPITAPAKGLILEKVDFFGKERYEG